MAEETSNLPSTFVDAGGFEELDASDYKLPIIKLMQQMSPELNRTKGEYNPDAGAGDFVNSATQEVYGEEISIIVAVVQSRVNEWAPLGSGGGFAGSYTKAQVPTDYTENEKRQQVRPSGNVLTPTMYYYVLICKPDGTYDRGVLTLKGTQYKKAKAFNTMMEAARFKEGPNKGKSMAPYSFLYDVKAVVETGTSYSWFGYGIKRVREVAPEEYELARAFKAVVDSGAQVQHEGQTDETTSSAEPTNF